MCIQALERRQRRAGVVVFPIIVVSTAGAGLRRPAQQLGTPGQAHRDAQRRLMRRRDERHARPWRPLASGLHNQTFAIDRHRHETAAVTLQNLAGGAKPGSSTQTGSPGASSARASNARLARWPAVTKTCPVHKPRRAKPTDRPRSPAASPVAGRIAAISAGLRARNLLAASRSHCLRGKASSAGMPSWNGGGAASKPCMAATPGAGAMAACAGRRGASAPRGRQARRHHGAGLAPGQEVALAHELAVGQGPPCRAPRPARWPDCAPTPPGRPAPAGPARWHRESAGISGGTRARPGDVPGPAAGYGRAFMDQYSCTNMALQLSHGSPNLAA